MTTPYYVPEESVPLPPPDADVISTACDYCIVACGYKVYRWPVRGGKVGGPLADQNAFGTDFPVDPLGPWIAPNQHNIVLHNGEPHHVAVSYTHLLPLRRALHRRPTLQHRRA